MMVGGVKIITGINIIPIIVFSRQSTIGQAWLFCIIFNGLLILKIQFTNSKNTNSCDISFIKLVWAKCL